MKKILEEFKAFALKGNMIDMAVAVIIGGAFNGLITSLVENVVMPALSLITGKIDFSNMFIALNGEHYATLEAAKEQTSVIAYGLIHNPADQFPNHGLCRIPCHPPAEQAVQETGHRLQRRPRKSVRTARPRLPSRQHAARTAPPFFLTRSRARPLLHSKNNKYS